MSESLILAQAVRALQRRIDRLERKEVLVGLPNLTRGQASCANGDNHNVDIGGATYIRLTGPTGAFAITGFTGGADARLLIIRNTTSQAMTIKHGDTGSVVENRISNATGADIAVGATTRAIFIYDSASLRWVLLSASGSTGAA
jgi:hypothetical protein